MKGTPFKLKQKLKPAAAKRKAEADLAMAKTPYRRAAKADSQMKHRNSPVNKNKIDKRKVRKAIVQTIDGSNVNPRTGKLNQVIVTKVAPKKKKAQGKTLNQVINQK